MTVESVSQLRDLIQQRFSPDYTKKMLHSVPVWEVVKDRASYLAGQATGKAVLDIGCTGPLSAQIKAAAATYYGVDREAGSWTVVDLDREPERLPTLTVDLVICSEVLEHLANPGRFLDVLAARYPDTETIFTVPHAGAYTVYRGCEMVNKDHVAWYSPTTLSTLLTRSGYTITDGRWYNGQPHKCEGLIVHARSLHEPAIRQGPHQ